MKLSCSKNKTIVQLHFDTSERLHLQNFKNKVCYCSLITTIPIAEKSVAHKPLTLWSRWVLFLRTRMTSNSPQVPSGGKLKLLWKGTDLKSPSDKHAQAYFMVLIYLLVTEGLSEGLYVDWVDWWNSSPSWYCSCEK